MNFMKTDTLAPIMSIRRPEAESWEVFVRPHFSQARNTTGTFVSSLLESTGALKDLRPGGSALNEPSCDQASQQVV
jgi:hypothetical protein